MAIEKTEFTELEREISKTSKSVFDCLTPEIGKVYVVSITRDGCPACKKQKPKMDRLAKSITEGHGSKVVFKQVHVKHSPEHGEESLRSKDVLGHYFYPTNLILLKTRDRGAIEFYKSASPAMSELKKNIEAALEIATAIEKQTN